MGSPGTKLFCFPGWIIQKTTGLWLWRKLGHVEQQGAWALLPQLLRGGQCCHLLGEWAIALKGHAGCSTGRCAKKAQKWAAAGCWVRKEELLFKDGDLHEVQHKWGNAWEASWKSIKVIALKSEQKNHGKKSLSLPKWQQGEWGVWGRQSAKEAPGITPIAQAELLNFLPKWNKNRKPECGLAVSLGTAGPCPWWLQAAPPGPHRPSLACSVLRWGLCRGLTVPWAEWENLCGRPAASPEPLLLFLRSLVGGCWSLCSPDKYRWMKEVELSVETELPSVSRSSRVLYRALAAQAKGAQKKLQGLLSDFFFF